jgi:hypothetical protein
MSTNKKALSVKERLELIMAGIGPTVQHDGWPLRFTHLTGAMLRKLIDAGAVILRGPDEPWGLDTDIFKCGNDEESLGFLEQYPRFFAQGYFDEENGTISIDTIYGAEKVKESDPGSATVTFLVPKLTKKELFAFANRFHRADEFEIHDDFAHAWFD